MKNNEKKYNETKIEKNVIQLTYIREFKGAHPSYVVNLNKSFFQVTVFINVRIYAPRKVQVILSRFSRIE